MYSNNQKTQSYCLICGEPLLKEISFIHMVTSLCVCKKCLESFEIKDYHLTLEGYPIHILYDYNDFFKGLLYQYKGLYDYALKDAFLTLYKDQLTTKYKDYVFVVAPSSEEDNANRGFAPVESIAKTLSDKVFNGLYKKEKYKQSDLRYEERSSTKGKIGIKHGEMLKGKKVVIMDDVVTSSQTLRNCLSHVLKQDVECVEFLVLSSRKTDEELLFDRRG